MKEIRFGVSISLSGRYSVQGIESFEGLNLWVKDANQLSGIFIRIEKGVRPLFSLFTAFSQSNQTGLLKTVVALSGHDDMIQDTKSENLPGFRQLVVHAHVSFARLKVT